MVKRKGQKASLSETSWCLCHGDFQPGNILQPAPDKLRLINWDGPVWAPPERDLMFVDPEYRSGFEQGYGPCKINESVADYLSTNWLLQELLDCAGRVLFSTFISDAERRSALEMSTSLVGMREAPLSDC